MIIEEDSFLRETIVNRIEKLEFSNISRFELFLWDLEIFLQIQNRLADDVILKGGAATQFYIPVKNQRTSIDIDMICTCSIQVVENALKDIEVLLNGEGQLFKFKEYKPKNPRIGLDDLKTYFIEVPTICSQSELYNQRGIQEVKVEFLFSKSEYKVNKIKSPELFATETAHEFNLLPLEYLFADKLTTLGTKTIGITDDRIDELFKQVYDVITLFESNAHYLIKKAQKVKAYYEEVARIQCKMRSIVFDEKILYDDMLALIKRIQNIEDDSSLMGYANDFQSLYLRKSVNRVKSEWAIAGMMLEMIYNKIFKNISYIDKYFEINEFISKIRFENIKGPERGNKINKIRENLHINFENVVQSPETLFRKQLERIIWELAVFVDIERIIDVSKVN